MNFIYDIGCGCQGPIMFFVKIVIQIKCHENHLNCVLARNQSFRNFAFEGVNVDISSLTLLRLEVGGSLGRKLDHFLGRKTPVQIWLIVNYKGQFFSHSYSSEKNKRKRI